MKGKVLPILFNTDMVQAILDGRKTATRRVIKKENVDAVLNSPAKKGNPDISDKNFINLLINAPCRKESILYVQETWKIHAVNPSFCMMIRYKADNFCNLQVKFLPSRFDKFQKFYEKNGWQSPYFMPKEAARIWLKVTDVRAERLHDMASDDCLKEGIRFYDCPAGFTWKSDTDMKNCYTDALGAMNALWDSTVKKTDIGQYGWDANPWVWVIEFERCGKPEGEE